MGTIPVTDRLRRILTGLAALALVAIVAGSVVGSARASTRPAGHKGNKVCHRHSQKLRGRHVHCVKNTRKARRHHRLKDHRTRVRYAKIRARHRAHARARAQRNSAWVLPRYVVMCESGGNPRVVNRTAAGAANGYPAGLYQITGPTWRAYGGGRYAYSADQASVYEQGIIAKRVLANQGPRAWACW